MIIRWLFISYMTAWNSLKLLEKKIGTSTLPALLPSTCSIRLLDGFPYCRTREFIRLSICSARARTLPSYAASTTLDPKSKVSRIVLLLIFCGVLQTKMGPT